MEPLPEIILSPCKLFRAVKAFKKRGAKHKEFKVIRRKTEEPVGFIYNMPNAERRERWVFDPLLTPFTATELIDLAGLLTTVKLTLNPEEGY